MVMVTVTAMVMVMATTQFEATPTSNLANATVMEKSAASKHQGDTESKATRVMVQLAMTVM